MRIVCFPHFYYLSEASRLVEIGKFLRGMGQDVMFFSHGGVYEYVAQEQGFEVISVGCGSFEATLGSEKTKG